MKSLPFSTLKSFLKKVVDTPFVICYTYNTAKEYTMTDTRNPIAAQLHTGYYKKKVVANKKRKANKNACRKGAY